MVQVLFGQGEWKSRCCGGGKKVWDVNLKFMNLFVLPVNSRASGNSPKLNFTRIYLNVNLMDENLNSHAVDNHFLPHRNAFDDKRQRGLMVFVSKSKKPVTTTPLPLLRY